MPIRASYLKISRQAVFSVICKIVRITYIETQNKGASEGIQTKRESGKNKEK